VTTKNRNRLIVILILAVPTAIFIGSIFYSGFSVLSLPPMPNPNGYDDLMAAAKMLAPDVGTYSTSNLDEIQSVVSIDAPALELARAGLQKKCRVPLDYNPAGTAFTVRLMAMKYLARGFAAEGDLAEIQGHPEQAVKSYWDMIRLANEASRGGALIDELVGIAIEREGTDELRKLRPQLDAETCRETAAALESLDAQRQTWNDVMWQEHYWSHRTFPGIGNQIMRIVQYDSLKKVYSASERKFEEQQTQTRVLAVDFATRSYELDKGHPPATLSDLVTNYLQTIPIDPATGTNMDYLSR
jgi:hypothetical protein